MLIVVSVIMLVVLYYSSFRNIPVYMYKFEIGDVFIFTVNGRVRHCCFRDVGFVCQFKLYS